MPTHSRNTILLATDQQRSVLSALNAHGPHPIAYSPYGHRPAENGLLSLLGFNGEPPDPLTGQYHLGNGYRMYSPIMGRFLSPDRLSPFGKGGLNAYAYCGSDPVNRIDPTGKSWGSFLNKMQTLTFPKIPRIKTNSKPVQTTVSNQWEITEKTLYLDKRGNLLTRVINGDGKISRVPTEKLKQAQEQARNQARVQKSLLQTEAWVKTQLHEHVPTRNWVPVPKSTDGTQGISTQPALIPSKVKPHTAWSRRQLRKLEQAESDARHSHNTNEVIHYQNKLIRNGFDY
jgi:RHS repeat-associated protein